MRVRIHDHSIFNSRDPEEYRQLQRLFIRAGLGQHELEIADPEGVLESEFWTATSSELNSMEWQELVLRTGAVPAFASTAEETLGYALIARDANGLDGSTLFIVAPRHAGEWAEQPLRVLLENLRDAVLLHLAVQASGSSPLQSALEVGWLKPEGCGGSGEIKLRVWETRHDYERIFVVLDSDRTEPGGEEGKVARLLRQKLEEVHAPRKHKLTLHVLKRRELENYIPDSVWRTLVRALPKTRTSQNRGVDHRTALVYRWLLRVIESQRDEVSRHGQDALARVVSTLEKKAAHKVPSYFVHEELDEWLKLSPETKAVDDLKVRFGFKLAEEAVEQLQSQNFDVSWLDDEARAELREIARKLEEWL